MGQESLGQVPDSWRPPSGVRVCMTDDVLSDIVSTSVLILIKPTEEILYLLLASMTKSPYHWALLRNGALLSGVLDLRVSRF
jgi:hypothetical protein